jgi:hypothetical protein
MKGFVSFSHELETLLTTIVKTPEIHSKWLNTLSYLENCGARKIASCEHPTLVKEEMLKHASEEFRHAHYLKRQIGRVGNETIKTYSLENILGGITTLNYLKALDLNTSRYLQSQGLTKHSMKEAAYLLVTYAIEIRAGELYPIYDEILRKSGSRVTVKSILLEEKEHLREMEEGIKAMPCGFQHAAYICAMESDLCESWIAAVKNVIT